MQFDYDYVNARGAKEQSLKPSPDLSRHSILLSSAEKRSRKMP